MPAVDARAKDGQPSARGVLLCVAAVLLCLAAAAGGVTYYVLRRKADAAGGPNALRGTFVNPVIPGNFADPFVLASPGGGGYYAYATNSRGSNVQTAFSTNLADWALGDDALPVLPGWALPHRTWAPDVRALPGSGFVLYFSAHDALTGLQCVGVANGSSAAGPFSSAAPRPLICPEAQGGAIDPSAFVDADGTQYVVFKNNGNAVGMPCWLQIQRVTADGMALIGTPQRLIREDAAWEGPVIEAPYLVLREGTYYLFYSGNNFDTAEYAISYATSSIVAGPYTKHGPWIASTTAYGPVIGPGSASFIAPTADLAFIIYHSWDNGTTSARPASLAPLAFQTRANAPAAPMANATFGVSVNATQDTLLLRQSA